jgi:hypothetical protein
MRGLLLASNPEKGDFLTVAVPVFPDSAGNFSQFQSRAGALFLCDRTNDRNHRPRERSLFCLSSVYISKQSCPTKNLVSLTDIHTIHKKNPCHC